MSILGNYGYHLGWGQATAADVMPSSAASDTPKTQELANPGYSSPGAVPAVFGLPPILVTILAAVGLLYVIRALTVKGG